MHNLKSDLSEIFTRLLCFKVSVHNKHIFMLAILWSKACFEVTFKNYFTIVFPKPIPLNIVLTKKLRYWKYWSEHLFELCGWIILWIKARNWCIIIVLYLFLPQSMIFSICTIGDKKSYDSVFDLFPLTYMCVDIYFSLFSD